MNRLSEQQNLALGVLSGGIEVSLLHWMNTLKSFAQQRLVRTDSGPVLLRPQTDCVARCASSPTPVACVSSTGATQ